MVYNKQNWADGRTGGTPLSAERLNHMEDGIAASAPKDLNDPVTKTALDSRVAARVPEEVSLALAKDDAVAQATAVAAEEALRNASYGPNENVFTPVGGVSELAGSATYGYVGSNFYGFGISRLITTATSFNRLTLRAAALAGAEVTARIYFHATMEANLPAATPAATVVLAETDLVRFPAGGSVTPTDATIKFPEFISAPANQYLTVVLTAEVVDAVRVRIFYNQPEVPGTTRPRFLIATGLNAFTYGTSSHKSSGFTLDRETLIGNAQDAADEAKALANTAVETADVALERTILDHWQDGENRKGNASYNSNFYGYGQRVLMDEDVKFDTIKVPFGLPSASSADVTVKVYVSPTTAPENPSFNLDGTADYILKETLVVPSADVPKSSTAGIDYEINLSAPIVVRAGETLTVLMYTPSSNTTALAIRQFNTGVSPAPSANYKRWLLLNTLTTGTYPIPTYISAGFILGMKDELDLREAAFAAVAFPAPRVLLPSVVDLVVGDTAQLFTKAAIEHPLPESVPHTWISPSGAAFPRHYEVTPTAPGTISVKARVYNLDGTTASEATTSLRVTAAPSNPASMKRVMVVGDSLTAAQVWVPEFRRRLVGTGGTPAGRALTNVKFIGGTPISGTTEKFFGYGGWTMANWIGASTMSAYWLTTTHDKDLTDQKAMYNDSNGKRWVVETIESGRIKVYAYDGQTTLPASGTLTHSSGGTHTSNIVYTAIESAPATPFWDPAANGGAGGFSIKYWVDTYNNSEAPDIIPVLLGWNGMPQVDPPTGTAADHSAGRAHIVTFLDKVKAEYPSAKVMLMGLPIPSTNGGLGTSYGATGLYADFWRLRRLVSGYNLMLQALAADAAYSSMATYVAVGLQFDADYNMPGSTVPVNSRNTSTIFRATNGVHPDTSGYQQIADSAYRAIARLL